MQKQFRLLIEDQEGLPLFIFFTIFISYRERTISKISNSAKHTENQYPPHTFTNILV
ncbi:hypothetical protein HALDL1_03810 [Halobacterium sp. DL1]|nr:hypothetical protein HALDL1_03810 [Halobacterium sp. DL1]